MRVCQFRCYLFLLFNWIIFLLIILCWGRSIQFYRLISPRLWTWGQFWCYFDLFFLLLSSFFWLHIITLNFFFASTLYWSSAWLRSWLWLFIRLLLLLFEWLRNLFQFCWCWFWAGSDLWNTLLNTFCILIQRYKCTSFHGWLIRQNLLLL